MKLSSLQLADSISHIEAVTQSTELPEDVNIVHHQVGLWSWENPINGFTVIGLHYSANPAKRDPSWAEVERRKYGVSEWMREQELCWESLEGRPVYADEWDPGFHVSPTPIGWNPQRVVCRGWDFGLYPACLFGQYLPQGRLVLLREAIGEDIGFERFVEEVNSLSLEWFPGAQFVEFIDPTGRNRFGSDEGSYVKILSDPPIRASRVVPGANSKVERRKAVVDFLTANLKGRPAFLVDKQCETLIKGFGGGYFYPFGKNNVLKPDPEKNIFSHIHDAAQYLCSRVRFANLQYVNTIKIREPRYGNETPTAEEQLGLRYA